MPSTTYRPSHLLRLWSAAWAVTLGCFALVCLVWFLWSLLKGDFEDAAIGAFDAVAGGAFAAYLWRQSRLQIIASDHGLDVVNYFSTFRVQWDSIQRFDSPTSWGIRVIMKDGRVLWLNAVQKWNIAVWLNQRSRADEIANELTEHLAR